MADIFLSYNREDQATAKAIATALHNQGFEVWWDTVLRAGQTYDEVTERQLHDASAVVVLWSSRSVRSKWVRAEATLGDRKSALIPVMIEQCDRPIMFELIQTADLTKWTGDLEDQQWKAFVEDVREHVERKRGAKVAAAAAATTPAAAAATASSDARDTIEAAFWMSIKDDNDPSDFEAYLERYPNGHFAVLAKKRLAAMTAPKIAPAPVTPPVAQQDVPKAAPVLPPLMQAAPKVDAFQQRPVHAKEPPPKKKGGSPLPLLLGVAVIAAIAVSAFLLMPRGETTLPATQLADTLGTSIVNKVTAEIELATNAVTDTDLPTPPTPPPTPVATTFNDCEGCPEMKRLGGGKFTMGSPDSEYGHRAWEGPQREVTIAPLAISTHEVTFAEWDACLAAGGCNAYSPADKGWGRGARPVIMVSWNEAQAYVKWLSGKTGKTYRLPTESEWEYAARGGTTTAYWWGGKYEQGKVTSGKTAEVGSHEANAFGLYDVTGNVAEWVEDCYVNSFKAAPTDGAAVKQSGCQHVVRGGGWKAGGGDLRIANRSRLPPTTRDTAIGFRVVVTE